MTLADYDDRVHDTTPEESAPDKDTRLSRSGVQSMQGLDAPAEDAAPASDAPEQPERQIIGDPAGDAQFWREQQYPDTCAVVAQDGVIEKHKGISPGEETLRYEAYHKGWYRAGGGTPMGDMGKLLESHDVPVAFRGRGDMDRLKTELEEGRDVLVGLDAGYLWQDADSIGEGHAVWVTGLEIDGDQNITDVYLNDSGNPAIGGGGKVPSEIFQNAWSKADNYMAVTLRSASAFGASGG